MIASLPLANSLHRATLHGSVYFKALDDAAFFAASSLVHDVQLVTVQFTVYFLAPVAEGRITAKGRVVRNAGRFILAEASLTDDSGQEIGRGSGMFVRSRTGLCLETENR